MPRLSIVIPTLNAAGNLAATLTTLVPGVVTGLLREVIVVDGGSSDQTLEIADAAGCSIVTAERGRGAQLAAGASATRGDWIMFLHADTTLDANWEHDVAAFIERIENGERPTSAAAFRFALDDLGFLPRLVETGVAFRCALFRMPFGDQGLLIPKRLYDEIGGYAALPLMEDVDIVRRLGRKRTTMLRTRAITSPKRYKNEGYIPRVLRNWTCYVLYRLHAPMRVVRQLYG